MSRARRLERLQAATRARIKAEEAPPRLSTRVLREAAHACTRKLEALPADHPQREQYENLLEQVTRAIAERSGHHEAHA